ITLKLQRGLNRLCVRLQCFGVRDTRILFGLFVENPAGVAVSMPGAARIAEAADWIDTVRAPRANGLESAKAAPFDARVVPFGSETIAWPAGASTLAFSDSRPMSLTVET